MFLDRSAVAVPRLRHVCFDEGTPRIVYEGTQKLSDASGSAELDGA